MKLKLFAFVALFSMVLAPVFGQENSYSIEGNKKHIAPEFTVRASGGFFASSVAVTGGVKFNDKRTVGLMLCNLKTYDDADPSHAYFNEVGVYYRRTFKLGKRNRLSLYNDIALAYAHVYKETGIVTENTEYRKGDDLIDVIWQPGLKIRFYNNFHMFMGPQISGGFVGLHLGIGL